MAYKINKYIPHGLHGYAVCSYGLFLVIAGIFMAYIVMAYIVIASIVIASIVMAGIVIA